MAKELNIDSNILDEEYLMLKEELDSLDELYDEAKSRLDAVSKYPTKANPVFMANQTSNLISIKEKRLNIIKEMTNIKKSKIDIDIKEFNANNKLDENETGYSKDILDIYRLLNKNDKSLLLEESIKEESKDQKDELSNSDLDKLLNDRLNEDNNDNKKQQLPSEYSIVVDKDKNIYVIDKDYNIIEDYSDYISNIKIIRFETINDEEYAYDENDNAYEIVET